MYHVLLSECGFELATATGHVRIASASEMMFPHYEIVVFPQTPVQDRLL